jgi:three-Cys-motif partner protein
MNNFGGDWTKIKIEILVEYAKAYLQIMKDRTFYKLLYFDGFAGSGFIIKDKNFNVDITVGAARRIIELEEPRSFDEYYFVEKDLKNFNLLKENTKDSFKHKKIHVIQEDCNIKIKALSKYLSYEKNKNYRTLAYVDPCGMQVEWSSIESLKGLNLDMWILVPTGLGVNRLLKNNGDISDAWLKKLELFLGLKKEEIINQFYVKSPSLFEDITFFDKEVKAIEKSAEIYRNRLKEIFEYVSKPYELRNKSNSLMYHLFLTSNNKTAVKIGNDIVKKYNR